MRCPTCGAPSANNEDRDWDQVTHSQWAVMFHASELLAALKAMVAAIDNREDGYFPGLSTACVAADEAIAKAEGRGNQ
jgi:hypothetical protein